MPDKTITTSEYLSLENLHTCLIEEAAEVAKVISKARRFGLEDCPPEKVDAITNRVKLAKELGDLLGVMNMIEREYCDGLGDVVAAMARQKEERVKLNYGGLPWKNQ